MTGLSDRARNTLTWAVIACTAMLVVLALVPPRLLDEVARVGAVVLACHIFVTLQMRAFWWRGLAVWNERTKDVWFRDSVTSGVVILAVTSVLLPDLLPWAPEARGVLVLVAMVVTHRVVMKTYDDPTVNSRLRGR